MPRNNNSSVQRTLPIDIFITEILPKLPAASLLRFKCLNKFFYGLISSKKFINEHLCQSQSQSLDTNGLLIYYTPSRSGVQGIYSLDLDTPNSSARYIPLPKPYSGYFNIVGSCNGLICLRAPPSNNKAISFIVVNPSTRIVKPISSWRRDSRSQTLRFGFGYDRINDDYKVVVVGYIRFYYRDEMFARVSVCSMKTNSWRYVKSESISRVMFHHMVRDVSPNGVLTKNHLLHWAKLSSKKHASIGCFNLTIETWVDDVPFPEFVGQTRRTNCDKLGVFDGCLCMYTRTIGLTYKDLWVMKEYGVKKSWVKLYTAATPTIIYNPLFANGKKELLLTKVELLYEFRVRTYVWYNLRDRIARMFEVSGDSSSFFVLTRSLKTLVDIHGGRQIKRRKATKSSLIEEEDS